MQQVLWAMVPSSATSSFEVCGQHHSNPCLLRTRNCFPLLWLRTYGVLKSPRGGSSSGMTMKWRWLFCLLAPLEILPLMVPMHFLALLAVRHSFSFKASSVHAKANPVTDTLSRFQFQRFQHLALQAENADPSSPDLLTVLRDAWQISAISSSPRALLRLRVRCTCPYNVATLISAVKMNILVLMVPFSQPISRLSFILPRCWRIALIIYVG